MKQFFKYALPGFLLLSIIVSCVKEYETIEVIDDRNVKEYIQQNNLSVQEYQGSGIYYQVVSPGTGAETQYSDQTPAIFTMRSLDGKYVSVDTFTIANRYYNYLGYFNPEAVRAGIKEVLKKSNGTLRVIIPSRLAFGRNGTGNIPGNASLDIVVKVLEKDKIPQYDDYTIKMYLEKNAMTGFTKSSSGIYYKIDQPGTGSPITIDSTVVANYTGKLLNGTIFDKAVAGSEATFSLTSVIKGWQEAIPLIKQGGSIRMVIPSALGYGMEGSSTSIPPFSCLDFEVKVTDVK
ncbi:MAG: FKBP-type peptidyl-prolyl cis-trans isomerase [Pedobacter sp.]|jgi:FKBP-type peptidyl-prolyl cis-trans isomerase